MSPLCGLAARRGSSSGSTHPIAPAYPAAAHGPLAARAPPADDHPGRLHRAALQRPGPDGLGRRQPVLRRQPQAGRDDRRPRPAVPDVRARALVRAREVLSGQRRPAGVRERLADPAAEERLRRCRGELARRAGAARCDGPSGGLRGLRRRREGAPGGRLQPVPLAAHPGEDRRCGDRQGRRGQGRAREGDGHRQAAEGRPAERGSLEHPREDVRRHRLRGHGWPRPPRRRSRSGRCPIR